MKLREQAPWLIPKTAQVKVKTQPYLQVKYRWRWHGWNYEARWHEKINSEKIIAYPSWRLDRVKPGKGYGKNAAPRIKQVLVGKNWLAAKRVRWCAKKVSSGTASAQEIKIIKACHFRGKS